jgi:glutamate-1-semialdehyde aminotransferase
LLPEIEPGGVPRALSGSVIPFSHGDPGALDAAVAAHGSSVAAIVIEPARYSLPPDGYLAHVLGVARRIGAVLVFDEITSGFRMHVGGLHRRLGVDPDICVFAKAMSNGFPMAAVIGRAAVMDAVERSFISSTYWSERIGPCAALATIKKLRELDVPSRLCAAGERMRAGWNERARRHGLSIATKGIPPLPSFSFDHPQPKMLSTLYTQLMLEQGYLASSAFYASYAHTDDVIDAALEATDRSFAALSRMIAGGTVERSLRGSVAHAGLRKT